MKHFIFIILLSLNACQCMAEDLPQPVNQFVKELFDDPEVRPDFREMWKAITWPEYSSERNDPNGGYLFRFQLQFENGNDTLAFIASDRFGDVRRSAPSWSVYQKIPEGQWREIGRNEIFQSGGISVHHPSRTIIQVFPDRFDEGKTYVTLKINEDGSVHKESYRSDQLNEEAREMIEKEAVPIVPEIEKIPLAAYLLSPQAEWRPLSEHGMAAQSLDPSDAPLLASSKDLEWSQAVDLAKTLTDNPSEPEPQRPHASSEPMPAPKAPDPLKSPKAEPTSVEESPVSPRWPLVAAVVAAALGLLWVWLKKRK